MIVKLENLCDWYVAWVCMILHVLMVHLGYWYAHTFLLCCVVLGREECFQFWKKPPFLSTVGASVMANHNWLMVMAYDDDAHATMLLLFSYYCHHAPNNFVEVICVHNYCSYCQLCFHFELSDVEKHLQVLRTTYFVPRTMSAVSSIVVRKSFSCEPLLVAMIKHLSN